MSDRASTDVFAVFELPAIIGVTPSCFGKTLPARIGGRAVKVSLPGLRWEDGRPTVVPPTAPPAVANELFARMSSAGSERWGQIGAFEREQEKVVEAMVHSLLLKARVPTDEVDWNGKKSPKGPFVDALFAGVGDWFEKLSTWVQAAVDQDVNPNEPLPVVRVQGDGLHLVAVRAETISRPAESHHLLLHFPSTEAVNATRLAKIFRRVNANELPGDPHLLLLDARAEIRRDRHRRAVIDAGTAVEVALADFNRQVTKVKTGPRPTLGWYVNQNAIAAAASLPGNTSTDLVDVRNKAIHENRTPSTAVAKKAVALAGQIVGKIDPLSV